MEFQPMSPEDMERTMQFLLHQQAQFAVDLAAMEARFDARLEKLTGKTGLLADALHGLTGIVGNLASRQERTDAQLRDTNQQVGELSGHIERIGSHLAVVVDMFERHLREDHRQRPS